MSSKDDLGWSRTIVSCCIQQLLHSTELLSHIDGSFHHSEVYQPRCILEFPSLHHEVLLMKLEGSVNLYLQTLL